jgi:hypothetical protein
MQPRQLGPSVATVFGIDLRRRRCAIHSFEHLHSPFDVWLRPPYEALDLRQADEAIRFLAWVGVTCSARCRALGATPVQHRYERRLTPGELGEFSFLRHLPRYDYAVRLAPSAAGAAIAAPSLIFFDPLHFPIYLVLPCAGVIVGPRSGNPANPNHGSLLPANWRTLYDLSKLPVDELRRRIAGELSRSHPPARCSIVVAAAE